MYGQSEPDYGGAVGLLQHLTVNELKSLVNDDGKVNDMLKDLPQVRSAEMEKEMLMASNKSLAEFNLSREPRLRQAKQRLNSTYEKASRVYSEAEQSKRELDDLSSQASLDTTLALLQTSAAQAEDESEELADKLLEGNLDVDTFLEDFQNKRKLAHLRRIRVEKMTELMNRQKQSAAAPAPTNWAAAPPPTQNAWAPGPPTNMYGQPLIRMPVMPNY